MIMAKNTTTTDASSDVAPAVAEQAELPAQLYRRESKPNPREADVKMASEAPLKDDGTAPWFRIKESDVKAAKSTDTLLRRAAKALDVKISVKLPQTQPGAVYFSVPVQTDEDTGNTAAA